MSDSFPIPGAWDSRWDSPVATTQGHELPVPAPPEEVGNGIARILATQSGTVPVTMAQTSPLPIRVTTAQRHESPLPTILDPPVPIPTTQVVRHRTWDRDYNPSGFPRDIVGENKPPIVIAVFGQTGTGKTSFIKTVTKKDLPVGHGLTSCTEDVHAVPCRIGNENVLLIDTPGFSDTNLSDTEILRRIATWMKDTYDDGSLLSGIIYLHRIIDVRMEGPSLKNLRMMRKLCGVNSLRNVVLATTMWERVTAEEGLRREAELKQDFWKDMINGGSTVTRIRTETGDDAHALVKSLLKNKPVSTRLQEELHSGKSLIQTEAGTEIREEIAKLEQKLKAEHQVEMVELKAAQRDRNQELERAIREELRQNHLRIARLEAEKEELENSTPKALPRAKRVGLFGMGSYHCLSCDRKTNTWGRWTCKNCKHQQINVW